MNKIEKMARDLLHNYYQGLTTIEEEDFLTHFFANEEIPQDLIADRELFVPKAIVSPGLQHDLEQGILNAISDTKPKRKRQSATVFRMVTTWAAAASIVIVLGVTWLLTNDSNENLYVDTYDDPYLALQETQRVLGLVGSKISMVQSEMKSLEMLKLPNQMLEPVNELTKNLQHLDKIKTIEKPKEMPFIKHIFDLDYNDKSIKN